MNKHVWYFADVNKIAIVKPHMHWYWEWFCTQVPHAVYLGKL